jgi:hypothetical protein
MLEIIKDLFSYSNWATPPVISALKTLPQGHEDSGSRLARRADGQGDILCRRFRERSRW